MEYAVAVKLSFWVGFLLAGQIALTVGLGVLLVVLKGAAKALKGILEEAKKWMEENGDDE